MPATIPTGTILYHGRIDNRVPDVPEWFAFDFEHGYLFCVSPCYVISLQAKRDLRLLYLDGSSAAKMNDGPMDSQDIVAWGKPRPEKFFAELERIDALCEWGKPYGLDGFVRMEFHLCVSAAAECIIISRLIILYHSEAMICNVSDTLEVVTLLDLLPTNVTERNRIPLVGTPSVYKQDPPPRPPPGPPPRPPHVEPPPGWRGSLPDDVLSRFEAHVA